MQKDNYSLLIEKLDAFIRKFYINHLLRGALYTVGTVLGLFILLNVLEYYLYFSSTVRTSLFWGFIVISGIALWQWVAIPLLHYFRLGKVINHEQAAVIIGNHFGDVKDKLLNILQLRGQANNPMYAELIRASINQKSESIKLVPFQAAIDLSRNRKHLRWALPPLLLLLFLMQCAPGIIREGSMRLWNNNIEFEKPAPFKFLVHSDSLKTVQFSDYVLKVQVEGQALPKEVFIDLGNVQYRLNKDAANEFSYKFTNVQQDTEFKLFGGGVESRDLTLAVIRKPSIASFDVKLNFPAYIGRADEQLANVGDLVVPQGTQLNWIFNAQNTELMRLRIGSAVNEAKRFDDDLFSLNHRAMKDETYKVFISNANLPNADSVAYTITVIPDLLPQIAVESFRDSSNNQMIFFAGEASDDYGLGTLSFNYQITRKGSQMPVSSMKVEKTPGKQATYEYAWEIGNLTLEPGDEVNYYFEVFDNDGVNGAKSARTQVMQYRMPTLNEYRDQQAQNSEEIKKNLEKAIKESLKVQEDIKKIREKVLQKKELDWQSRKELERLMNRQQQLQQQLEQAKQEFMENKQQQQQMNQQQEELQQKQEQLEKMFDEVLSEEMKQLMEEIQKMMEEMTKEETLEKMEEMQLSNEEMNKELDRLQELYKQLEVEQKLDEQIQRLEELAKEQDKLSQETENSSKPQEQLEKKQEELNKEMEDIKKEQEDLQQKNEELKRPQKIEDMKKEMEDTKEDMEGASDDMEMEGGGDQKEKNKSAAKKQKKAANKMKNMANKMKSGKKQGEKEELEEDLKTIRQLLENLVGLSFNQEQTMKDIRTVNPTSPRYVELTQQQFKIKDDFRLVEDSLQALARRQFAIEGVITEKVTEIKGSLKKSLAELEERNTGVATEFQQLIMKDLNDLALLLAEAMQNMQNQMAGGMPGNQACEKPGKGSGKKGGREPSDKISKGQGGLGESLQQMKERMKNGQVPSKEFAQMAARQAAMRNALRDLQKAKQEQGKGSKALDEIMQQMNEIETDLVNKRLTNETLERQQSIMTRLLEEERAEREQEEDEKREAEQARQQSNKMPPALEEYLKKRRAETEQYRTVSPALKPYYKGLVEEYLKGVNK
jgi:hypothetical protein